MSHRKSFKVVGLFTLFYLSVIFLSAQNTTSIRARVVDGKSGAAVPFATVKILKGQSLIGGVISNADGDFQIPRKYHSFQNSIVITCIGYASMNMKMSELLPDKVNVIKLKEATTQLKEVTIRSKRDKKLNAHKIVQLAIENISRNYPSKPYSYLAYYRDYQKEEKEYVNLNEALIRVFDKGFSTNDFDSSKIKLYQYNANKDFKRDSLTALAYDNNNFGGKKFIPTATVTSFGGNELSLLRIHDAIRNNEGMSFSFVNTFKSDFQKNHRFTLLPSVFLDNTPLYHIAFESFFFVTGRDHFAKGEIFIEPDNFAIHKLVYATYLREARDERLLYKVQLEYTRTDSLMHLNYISFNNFFKSKYDDGFKANDIVYDRTINAFVVTFNRTPQVKSVLNKNNYEFKFEKAPMLIDRIELTNASDKEVRVYIQNANNFNLKLKPADLVKKFEAKISNVKDIDGNVINEIKYKQVSQFREMFMQRLDTSSERSYSGFISKNIPLYSNHVYEQELLDASNYWMNTPLKDNSDWMLQKSGHPEKDSTVQTETASRTDELKPLQSKPIETVPPGYRNISELEEKVYVQTDKPYYYPGETIWFKAYMNYRAPFWKDSLSRVLYVELISPTKEIVQLRTMRIDNGTSYGGIDLPTSIKPANYFLRAYTNWMSNYDDKDLFVKPIRIFNVYEEPEGNNMDTTRGPVSQVLSLQTQKLKYKPREEVKLEINLRDLEGNRLGANLSIAVTDMMQVTPVSWEKNIMKNYAQDTAKRRIKADTALRPIEFGISIRGKYANKKQKSLKTKLIVIETKNGKLQDFVPGQTNEKGKFWITGLQFYDSAAIGLKVDNAKVRGGTFELYPREIPFTFNMKSDSILKVKSKEKPQYVNAGDDWEKNATLLKEVVVEGVRIKERPRDPIYGQADFSISSEEITRYNDLSFVLLNKIPGLLTLNVSSFNSHPPLVIIDGVRTVLEGADSDKNMKGFMDAVSAINVFQIERIDFFKYGNSAFYGAAGGGGVLIIHTKKSNYDAQKLEGTIDQKSFQTFKVMGYSPVSTFTSPDYSKKENSTQADYRSTILWQPEVKLEDGAGKATIHFYTADLPGRYRIVVEGVTSDFAPVRNVMFIEVVDTDK